MIDQKAKGIIDTLPPFSGVSSHDDVNLLLDNDFGYLVKAIDGHINGQVMQGAGVLMTNPNYQDNLIIYDDTSHYQNLLARYENHAIMLGDETADKIAVLGIDNALAVYADDDKYCVLTLPYHMEGYFERMVNAFGVKYAFTTHDKPIAVNATVVQTIAPLSIELNQKTLDDVLGDADTAIFEAWQTPTPLSKPTAKNPYPIGAFDGQLRAVVEKIAYYAQVPLSMAGQSVLGALSTIGQMYVNAPMGSEHKPSSLFLLTEAPSGSGKTQVNKLAYKAVKDYEKALYKQFLDDMEEWQAGISQAGKAGKEYQAQNPKPKDTQKTLNEGTIEGILDRFIIDGMFNQSWVTDEAGQFFGGYSMKADTVGNALSSITSLYSGGEIGRLRSTRNPHASYKTKAFNCRLTLDLAGQRVVISQAMNNPLMIGQGLLARCLISAEPSLIGERDWASHERQQASPYDDKDLITYWERCKRLLDPPPSLEPITEDGTPNRYNMPFDNGARQALADFQQVIEYEQRAGNRLYYYQSFANRMAENATRIATLMAFYDEQKRLSIDYLQRAFLLVEYSIKEVMRYQDIQETSDSEKLLNWLIRQASNGKVSKSHANRNAPIRGKALTALLDDLQSDNYLRLQKQGKAIFIQLNPCLL